MNTIDAVITWVDGSDPNYKIKYNYHSGQMRNFKEQYLQDNEIVFCVSSILKYAPFVRKIFIVTDNQVPNFKKIERIIPKNKIKIIDHKEIFEGLEDHLPTFNIRSIDAVLHRIKGLSEKYIYFNDDMFLIKETKINDWFSEDKAVLTGNWVKSYNIQVSKRISQRISQAFKKRPSFNEAQSKAANIAGFNEKYFKSYHSGRPQIKSIIQDFYTKHPDILIAQIKHKFRSTQQHIPYSLCWHLIIKQDMYKASSKKTLLEIEKVKNLNKRTLETILLNLDKNEDVKFLNVQDLNYLSKESRLIFNDWISKKLDI